MSLRLLALFAGEPGMSAAGAMERDALGADVAHRGDRLTTIRADECCLLGFLRWGHGRRHDFYETGQLRNSRGSARPGVDLRLARFARSAWNIRHRGARGKLATLEPLQMLSNVGSCPLRFFYQAVKVVALALEVVDRGFRPVIAHGTEGSRRTAFRLGPKS